MQSVKYDIDNDGVITLMDNSGKSINFLSQSLNLVFNA